MLDKEHSFLSQSSGDVNLAGRVFIGYVTEACDPKASERVKVAVIGVHDMSKASKKNSIWAHHCAFSKYQSGEIPEKGDFLYVMFPNPNDPMYCIWLGWVRGML